MPDWMYSEGPIPGDLQRRMGDLAASFFRYGNWLAELRAMRCSICGAYCIHLFCHDFEVLDLITVLSPEFIEFYNRPYY